jgi:hypothetical protein
MAADLERRRGTRGIEGLKRQLEQARSQVQGTLQQAGAEFYQAGSEMIQRFVNRLSDNYTTLYRREVNQAFETATRGTGAIAEREMREVFGLTRGAGGGLQEAGAGLTTPAFDPFRGTAQRNVTEFAERDRSRWREAGWGGLTQGLTPRGAPAEMAWRNIQGARRQMGQIRSVMAGRAGGPAVEVTALNEDLQRQVREHAQVGMARFQALDRVGEMQRFLTTSSNKDLQALGEQMASAPTDVHRTAIMRKIFQQVGRTAEEEARYWDAPLEEGLYDTTRFFTEEQMVEEGGEYLMGGAGDLRALGDRRGKLWGRTARGGMEERGQAALRYLQSEEGRDVLRRGMTPEEAPATRRRLMKRLEGLRRRMRDDDAAWRGDLGGEAEVVQRGIMMTSFLEMQQARPGLQMGDLTQEQLVRMGQTAGIYDITGGTHMEREQMRQLMTPQEIQTDPNRPEARRMETQEEVRARMAEFARARLERGFGMQRGAQTQARRQALAAEAERARERLGRMEDLGVITWKETPQGQRILQVGAETKEFLADRLGEEGGTAAREYIKTLAKSQRALASADDIKGADQRASDQRRQLISDHFAAQGDMKRMEQGQSVKWMRTLATSLMRTSPEAARSIAARADIQEYVGQRRGGRVGRLSRLAETLGIQGLGMRELKRTLKEEGIEGVQRLMAERGGFEGAEGEQLGTILRGGEGQEGVLGGREGVQAQAGAIQTLRGRASERRRAEETERKREDYRLMADEFATRLGKQRLQVTVFDWAEKAPKSGEEKTE